MISDLESRGFNGLILSWLGKGDQTDAVALKVQSYLSSSSNTNKNFHFIIMAVFGYFNGGETTPTSRPTSSIVKTNTSMTPTMNMTR